MHSLVLATAFIAGVLGSTHCVAMCGGIAAALGTVRGGRAPAGQALLYQLGRITSYGLAGALVGALGSVAGLAFETARWSALLRLASAAVVVMIGLDIAIGRDSRARWLRAPERWGAAAWRRVAPHLRSALPTQPTARALTMGFLWGWLPCGLVYSVLLAAAVSGSAAGGSLTMAAFGLGTLPAMLSLSLAGAGFVHRGTLARVLGSMIVACGLWTAATPIAVLSGAHESHHHHAMGLAVTSSLPPASP